MSARARQQASQPRLQTVPHFYVAAEVRSLTLRHLFQHLDVRSPLPTTTPSPAATMCKYRYIYYSRCSHCEMTLVDYCDKAYTRAGFKSHHLRNAENSAQSSASPSAQTTEVNNGKARCAEVATEEKLVAAELVRSEESTAKQDLPARLAVEQVTEQQQQTSAKAWASVAPSILAVEQTDPSEDTACPTALASPAAATRGRSGLDSTIRAAKAGSMTSTKLGREVVLPEEQSDKGAGLDLASSSAFPVLASSGVGRSSSITDRALSPLPVPWAHIVRSTGARWPASSSASEPPTASDAGTVSSPTSSIDGNLLDTVLLATPAPPKMAASSSLGSKAVRAKKPAPVEDSATRTLNSPRKRLPVEWTGGSPSSPGKNAKVLSRRKSIGANGMLPNTAQDPSVPPPKAPTKTIPFVLATARRAAAREQKERTAMTKIVPAVPEALTKDKASGKTHSKTSSDTSTTQYHTAAPSPFPSNSSQSYATAFEELHQTLSTPGSPSRIPRLIGGGSHGSNTRASGSEASPVRADLRIQVAVSGPLLSAAHVNAVNEYDNSIETVGPHEEPETVPTTEQSKTKDADVGLARSGMAKSDEALKKASSTFGRIRQMKHPYSRVHFEETSKAIESAAGLGVADDSSVAQTEAAERTNPPSNPEPKSLGDYDPASESPASQSDSDQATTRTDSSAPGSEHSGELADVESLLSSADWETKAAMREGTPSPEMINTWPEASESRGTYSGDGRFPHTVIAESEPSFNEGQSITFGLAERLQWSLNPNSCTPTLSTNTARAQSTNMEMPRPMQCNGATPSRLNAQAREFVPTPITIRTSCNTSTPASCNRNNWPQMPAEWQNTSTGGFNPDAKQDNYHHSAVNMTFSSGAGVALPAGKKYKKKKKSPKKTRDSSNQWGRPIDMSHGASGQNQSGAGSGSMSSGSAMPAGWCMVQTDEDNAIVGGRNTVPRLLAATDYSSIVNGSSSLSGWRTITAEEDDAVVSGPNTVSDLLAAAAAPLAASGPSTGSALSSITESSSPPAMPPMMGQYGFTSTFPEVHTPFLTSRQGGRPDRYLREITNMPYGQRRGGTSSGPSRQLYLGRGGSGIPTAQIPDGDHPHEQWWHQGYTSSNRGPLTMGSWYDCLRQSGGGERAQELYPSLFNAQEYEAEEEEGIRTPNQFGQGVMRTCNHIEMEGAFEALPHYPLLCTKCDPDWHPNMSQWND